MNNSYRVTHEHVQKKQLEVEDKRTIYPVYGYIDKYQVINPARV
jgi:hypothetical protein